MSAMIDTYDMQVLDYSQDHDIQMHASSSDQWFQDEAKMEEDVPTPFKDESDLHMNPVRYSDEKADSAIEVEMESALDPHAEFDMLDDDAIHTAEIVDVEVYDASHVQSSSMLAVDSLEGHFLIPSQAHVQELNTPNSETLPLESPNPLPLLDFQGMQPDATQSDRGNSADEAPSGTTYVVQSVEYQPSSETETLIEHSNSIPELARNDVGESLPTAPDEIIISAANDVDHRSEVESTEHLEVQDKQAERPKQCHQPQMSDAEVQQHIVTENEIQLEITEPQTDTAVVQGDGASSGDPHEISEGVYIDPPPPVLFSLNSGSQFNFSLFNEPSTWSEIVSEATDQKQSQEHVLLSSFPTLYYEPISAVFDALRQEESIHSMTSASENELVMEAVDLQLVISEDNIYAREVTLHDLNVLHDISGIDGLLRMRLYISTPRFISRYQNLQDEVSRLNLEAVTTEPNSKNTERTLTAEVSTNQVDYATNLSNRAHEKGVTYQESPLGEADAHTASHDDNVGGTLQQILSEAADVSSESQDPLSGDAVEPQNNDQEANEGASSEESHSTIIELEHCIAPVNHSAGNNENDDQTEATAYYDPVADEQDDPSENSDIAPQTVEANLPDATNDNEDNLVQLFNDETSIEHGEISDEVQEKQSDALGQHEHDENEEYHSNRSSVQNETDESDENVEVVLELGPNEEVENDADEYEDSTEDAPTSAHHLNIVDPQDPSSESIYDEASDTTDQAIKPAEAEIQGDAAGDASVSYEESVSSYTFDEFSRTEEIGNHTGTPSDYVLANSEFYDEIAESWAYDFDDKGEDLTAWNEGAELIKAVSNSSSTMLSTKASKRSFDEVDLDGEEYEYGAVKHLASPGSPGPKRTKTQ